jgi:hypothetical protein
MKIYPVPADETVRVRRAAALARNRKLLGIFSVVFAISAVLCLIATLVTVVVVELGKKTESQITLLWILTGAFAAGAVIFAALGFFLSRAMQSAYAAELDYRERLNGENSFFVGDGTLATFEADALRIHAEGGGREDIRVPYAEMRFFSVCTRRLPKEKGERSVVMEVPVKYLAKKGKVRADDPPALIQADEKERLLECLQTHGLKLVGEEPPQENRKFTLRRKFIFPDRAARKRSLIGIAIGALLLAGGIGAAFWQTTVGAILGVFGLFLIGRSSVSFAGAKRALCFYDEGVYWRERARTDCVFLKWNEILSVSQTEKDGVSLLKFECAYGAYHFANAAGAPEYLKEIKPDLWKD